MFSGGIKVKHWLANTCLKSIIKTLGQLSCCFRFFLFVCLGCLHFYFCGVLAPVVYWSSVHVVNLHQIFTIYESLEYSKSTGVMYWLKSQK